MTAFSHLTASFGRHGGNGRSKWEGENHAAEFPTKAVRLANSRLDLSRLRQVFGVTPVPWQEALRRELDILLQRG